MVFQNSDGIKLMPKEDLKYKENECKKVLPFFEGFHHVKFSVQICKRHIIGGGR